MTLDEIRELIQVAMESGVAELEVQRGENRVRIRRQGTMYDVAAPANLPVISTVLAAPLAAPVAAVPPTSATPPAVGAAPPAVEENLITIKSPIVGTYYDAASPGTPPFTKIGDTVEPGHVLCIIESMKLMNEIEAEVAGTVVAKHVDNGRPVEYGEPLFTVRPR